MGHGGYIKMLLLLQIHFLQVFMPPSFKNGGNIVSPLSIRTCVRPVGPVCPEYWFPFIIF